MKTKRSNSDEIERCIVLDEPLPAAQLERLRQLSPRVHVLQGLSNIAQADIVYTGDAKFDPADAPHLGWVQLNLVGIEHLLGGTLAKSGIPVANVRGAYTPTVAEFTIALLLSLSRRLGDCQRFQAASKWDDSVCGVSLYGKTMAIVGYGSIGRQIARIAHAMGIRILACKRDPAVLLEMSSFVFKGTGDPEGTLPTQWFGTNEIEKVFRATDYAVVTLPLTSDTRGLIGPRELSALPSHALLVNVGRGGVVDEAALAELLSKRGLAGAALDVFAQEPLPSNSPLWRCPNIIITPHIGSYTVEQAAFAGEVLIENVRRDLAGEPVLNVVNFAAGY